MPGSHCSQFLIYQFVRSLSTGFLEWRDTKSELISRRFKGKMSRFNNTVAKYFEISVIWEFCMIILSKLYDSSRFLGFQNWSTQEKYMYIYQICFRSIINRVSGLETVVLTGLLILNFGFEFYMKFIDFYDWLHTYKHISP